MTTKLYALYDSHSQSDTAVKAVTAADFEGLEITVIEELPGSGVEPGVPLGAPPVPSNLSSSGVAAALASTQADVLDGGELSDAQKAFLARGVRQGGTIVLVDAPEGAVADQVTEMLKNSGGRVLPE